MQTCQEQVFECLTLHAFGPSGREAVDPTQFRQRTSAEREDAFVRELTWRCAALEAAKSWVIGYVSATRDHQRQRRLADRVAEALRPILTLVASSQALQDPVKVLSQPRSSAFIVTLNYFRGDVTGKSARRHSPWFAFVSDSWCSTTFQKKMLHN